MYFLGTPTFTRDNRHRHRFLTMSFMERNVAPDKAHPSWHIAFGCVRKVEWNVFISGSAVTKAKKQALKASTKAIKERSATNFQATILTNDLLTMNIEAKKGFLIAICYAQRTSINNHLISK